jgi:hypothetical protein
VLRCSALPAGEIDRRYGGGFFFYPDGAGGGVKVFEARRNSAIMCDGSVMVHGTDPFVPPGAVSSLPPMIDKDKKSQLVFE